MGGPVGGSPGYLEGGANQLSLVSHAAQQASTTLGTAGTQASGAAGDPTLTGALDHFGTALTRFGADLAVQLGAAAMLAQNSSLDLSTAGGGPHPR